LRDNSSGGLSGLNLKKRNKKAARDLHLAPLFYYNKHLPNLVELSGIEPLTSTLPVLRSPS
jgi:hypothetical protein